MRHRPSPGRRVHEPDRANGFEDGERTTPSAVPAAVGGGEGGGAPCSTKSSKAQIARRRSTSPYCGPRRSRAGPGAPRT